MGVWKEGFCLHCLLPFQNPDVFVCLLQGKILGFKSIFHTEENTYSLYINNLLQMTANPGM